MLSWRTGNSSKTASSRSSLGAARSLEPDAAEALLLASLLRPPLAAAGLSILEKVGSDLREIWRSAFHEVHLLPLRLRAPRHGRSHRHAHSTNKHIQETADPQPHQSTGGRSANQRIDAPPLYTRSAARICCIHLLINMRDFITVCDSFKVTPGPGSAINDNTQADSDKCTPFCTGTG